MTGHVIAVVQYGIHPLVEQETFWDRVERYIREAEEAGVRLLVFPEYLTAHRLAAEPPLDHAAAMAFLDGLTDEYLERFSAWSRQTGITILGGTHIHRDDSGFVNEAFLFYPSGQVLTQKKVHLIPEERRVWGLTAGETFSVVETDVGKVAILICYDIEFPEAARIVKERGAEIILCPSYTDTAHGYHRVRWCAQSRAIENQLYVALSGMTGSLPHVPQMDSGYSRTGIFAPCDHPFPADGILSLAATADPTIVSAHVDGCQLTENERNGQVSPYRDRKPHLYARY